MVLKVKEKELAAVGISVAAGCRPCTDFHLNKVAGTGATDDQIRKAVADGLCVRRSGADRMEAFTLAELGDTPEPKEECSPSDDRITELTKIGAAFAVNCTENLDKHLAAGRNAGISEEDIAEIAKLAGFIRGKASSHVDKKVSVEEEEQEQSRPMAMAGGRSCC